MAAPFFYCGRGWLSASCRPSSSHPWLSSPLSSIPPFIWVSRATCVASGCRLARPLEHPRAPYTGHKEWLQQALLIPDVDYGRRKIDVKHKVRSKVKKVLDRARRSHVVSARRARRCALRRTHDRDERDRSVFATQRRSRVRCVSS